MHTNEHTVALVRWIRQNPHRRKDVSTMLDIVKERGGKLADVLPAIEREDCSAVITAALAAKSPPAGKAVQVL